VTPSAPSHDPAGGPAPRHFRPRRRPILHAVDLGSTAVLRHGALALVADPFGDIHPDSRGLGLYLADTRVLSGLMLLIDGSRSTLLQADPGGSDRGAVQLTNPELRNDPTRSEGSATLATQSIGIRRERALDPSGLHERVHVANFTMARQVVELSLLLDCDAADIFEIRGYTRDGRGVLADVAVDSAHVRFSYQGRDGRRLDTAVTFDVDPAPTAGRPARAQAPGPGTRGAAPDALRDR